MLICTYTVKIYKQTFLIFLIEIVGKFKALKKSGQNTVMHCLEVAIWNWMDAYPNEFGEIQVTF